MKLFITLSKKSLAVVFAALVVALVLIGQLVTLGSDKQRVATNAERCDYIAGLGYKVEETAVSQKDIVIPAEFSDVYERYNALQAQAGFDLAPYKGRAARVYTYRLADSEETVVNLIIYRDSVIGGDVSSVRIDGEMKALLPRLTRVEPVTPDVCKILS